MARVRSSVRRASFLLPQTMGTVTQPGPLSAIPRHLSQSSDGFSILILKDGGPIRATLEGASGESKRREQAEGQR